MLMALICNHLVACQVSNVSFVAGLVPANYDHRRLKEFIGRRDKPGDDAWGAIPPR
jgi:hypothetical protein